MDRHILVPLDGSRLAAAAVPYAATLARAWDARIRLLAVVEPLPEHAGMPSAAARERDERQVTESTAYLESVATALRAQALTVATVIRHGDPAGNILAYAEEAACTLVVMSTHGRTGLERICAGSVAQRVVRHASIPTLVVPRGNDTATDGDAAIAAITITLDGSTLAEEALPLAARLAAALTVPLTLLRAIPSFAYLAYASWGGDGYYGYPYAYPMSAELEAAEDQAAKEYLDAVATRLHELGLEVRTHQERSERPGRRGRHGLPGGAPGEARRHDEPRARRGAALGTREHRRRGARPGALLDLHRPGGDDDIYEIRNGKGTPRCNGHW